MSDLFRRGAVQQTSSDLPERWGQNGSNRRDATGGNGTTLLTVTAGKTFYCTSILYTGSAGNTCDIDDNTTLKIRLGAAASAQLYSVPLSTPLAFTTSVVADAAVGTWSITVAGWEE